MKEDASPPLPLETFKNYREQGFLVVDTRSPQEFSEGFIPGAVNIPYEDDFGAYVQHLVLSDRGLILVAHNGPEECQSLKDLGFSNVGGFLKEGMSAWFDAGEPLDMVISIGPHEFSLDFKHESDIKVYDLRPEVGFQQEHLKDSINKKPETLLGELEDFPTNKTFYVMCYDGYLSMGLIALIKARGYHNFYHVAGGYKAAREEEKVELIQAKGNQQKQSGNS